MLDLKNNISNAISTEIISRNQAIENKVAVSAKTISDCIDAIDELNKTIIEAEFVKVRSEIATISSDGRGAYWKSICFVYPRFLLLGFSICRRTVSQ